MIKKYESFKGQKYDDEDKDDLEIIMDIFNKHYSPSDYDYIGEYDSLEDFIEAETENELARIEQDLKPHNHLQYIMKYTDTNSVHDYMRDEYRGTVVKIGHWIWDISGLGDPVGVLVQQLKYDDEDAKTLEDYGVEYQF